MNLFTLITIATVVFYRMTKCENIIDMDDILSENYMPGSLLVLENPEGIKNETIDNSKLMLLTGTFQDALSTMGFHRKMMNEYLCRNFIAEQIVSEMTFSRMRRRLGSPAETDAEKTALRPSKISLSINNNMLEDEGSSNYKNWLAKSTTLEDIYRHYDNSHNRESKENGVVHEDKDENDEINEEFDSQVTDYVFQKPITHSSPSKLGHSAVGATYPSGGVGGYSYPSDGSHTEGGVGHSGAGYAYGGTHSGYSGSSGSTYTLGSGAAHGISAGGIYGHGGGHDTYGVHYGNNQHNYGNEHVHKYHESDKETDVANLFDIALTALAYLSFGMFIIHIVVCISMAVHNPSTTSASMSMMPMSMSPAAMEPTGMMGEGMTGGGGSNMGGGAEGGDSTAGGDGGTEDGGGTNGNDTGGGGDDGVGGEGMEGEEESGGTTGSDAGMNTGMGNDEGSVGEGLTGETGNGNTAIGSEGGAVDEGMGGTASNGAGTGMGDAMENGEEPTNGESGSTGSTANENGDEGGGTASGGNESTGADSTGSTGTGSTGGEAESSVPSTSDGDDIRFRFKRSMPKITQPNTQALNELARRVLISIESAVIANRDDGVCLRKSICENNKYSRDLIDNQKFLVPIWSLGMTWLSSKLVKGASVSTSVLESLKASVLGLGKADCELIYSSCNLHEERNYLRKERKKRSSF